MSEFDGQNMETFLKTKNIVPFEKNLLAGNDKVSP